MTVYEKADRIGGLLRYGIPEFKLEKRILQTLTDDHIQTLLSVKPKTFDEWRLRCSTRVSALTKP